MRLNHVPCRESLSTPITPESLQTHITQCQSPCVIKSIISGLHPMIILQSKFIVFKPKSFWMLHLIDHLYSKPCVFLWAATFRGPTSGFVSLPTLSPDFTVGHISIIKNIRAFIRGGIYPCLLLPDTYFDFHLYNRATLLNIVPSYRAHPIKHKFSVDYNHSLTPIQCDVPVHMQCNAPFHVISCHMYNECYMDIAKTIHFTLYHGQLYQSA